MTKTYTPEKIRKDWRKLEFAVPILHEKIRNEDTGEMDFLINGTAINVTTTRNGVKYKAEELEPSGKSLRDKPLLKDHNNSVDAIVGRTSIDNKTGYDSKERKINFKAKVMDKDVQEKISDGRIKNVSVGAMVKHLKAEEDADGNVTCMVAEGIEFLELSLVAVPGDPNAGIEQALNESYTILKESLNDNHLNNENTKINVDHKEEKMDNEKITQLEEKSRILEEQKNSYEAKIKEFEAKELKVAQDEYKKLCTEKNVTPKADFQNLSKETLMVLIETLQSIKVSEAPKKTDSTVGHVATESVETIGEHYGIELDKDSNKYAFYAKNAAEKHAVYRRD